MKKILLSVLIFVFSLFCITACGGVKKDPEVAQYIVDKVNTDIDREIPKGEIKIKLGNYGAFYLRERQLAKNIKVEVTDVISSKEYMKIYVNELERINKELEKQNVPKAFYMKIPSPEEIEERTKNPDIVYYKYVVTADIVNLDEILKELHPKLKKLDIDREIEKYLLSILNEENKSKFKYETVEGFGYCWYNTKTEECDYTQNALGFAKNFVGDLQIGPFFEARGHQKYNFNTPLEE